MSAAELSAAAGRRQLRAPPWPSAAERVSAAGKASRASRCRRERRRRRRRQRRRREAAAAAEGSEPPLVEAMKARASAGRRRRCRRASEALPTPPPSLPPPPKPPLQMLPAPPMMPPPVAAAAAGRMTIVHPPPVQQMRSRRERCLALAAPCRSIARRQGSRAWQLQRAWSMSGQAPVLRERIEARPIADMDREAFASRLTGSRRDCKPPWTEPRAAVLGPITRLLASELSSHAGIDAG